MRFLEGVQYTVCVNSNDIEMEKHLDNNGIAGAILMDLSKVFDMLNHELLVVKFEANGFENSALAILLSYLSERWQGTKINTSFST